MSPIPQTIGHYRIDREIGRGGMGVVYLAHDTKLDRDVAVKVLPADLTSDPSRLGRFEREAKLLASLSHSNIAAVHGLEELDDARYLILEFVEGETLDARLTHGPLPVDEALSTARQIAEAVEAAHEKGVVHRDLKPANVMLSADGKVKVLDFGLAKAFEDQPSSPNSPTVLPQESPTVAGVILGTAGYMSPEQARGRPVDKRTDIWSFGCILYEMLSGGRVFPGETVTDSIGATIHKEPDWSLLPPDTPPVVQLLLRRCLQKDRRRRLQDIGDARVEIEETLTDPLSSSLSLAGAALATRRRPSLAWPIAVAMVIIAAASVTWSLVRPSPRLEGRFSIVMPADTALFLTDKVSVALSPDGRRLVYGAEGPEGVQLFVREMGRFESTPIPETVGATGPFFSPDGQWVGYTDSDEAKLKKVPLQGGAPVTICDSQSAGKGADWGADDVIVFTPSYNGGLFRVSAAGGTPQALTTPDIDAGEKTHRFPEVLPGAGAVLFMIGRYDVASWDDARIAVIDLETGEQKILIEGGFSPRYVPTGHIVYGRAGSLFAVPFDLGRLDYLALGPFLVAKEASISLQDASIGLSEIEPMRMFSPV